MRHSQKSLFDLPAPDLAEITRDLEREASRLQGRRLFLSGGTGFFGKWLLAALAHANDELGLDLRVIVFSRDPADFLEKYPEAIERRDWQFLAGDVADFPLPPERCDFFIHAATDTLGINTPEQEEDRTRSILKGTANMLALARRDGARLLNISSGGIYGAAAAKSSGAREEDADAAQPVTPYARAKLAAEGLCAESDADFVTARAFAFLGPHLPLDAHYAAGNFLRDAHAGGPIRVRGDGTALRSYLYPTDLVTWLLRLLLQGRRGRAYNVGSDAAVSTGELARRVSAACVPAPPVSIQSGQPHGAQNIYLPDIARARQELGLKVQVDLNVAIKRSLAWLRTEPIL